ncbi:uncharacterized protein [Dysidea avara]|uniref:uncharacterized protein isoform X2 n=1 Tax=Dysidea avara TaxID=196820 RepID=UPI0033310F8E
MEKLLVALTASFLLVFVTSLPVSEKRDYQRDTETEEIFEDPPVVYLSCSELFFNETCTKLLVNVTWRPTEDDTPERIQDRLQNCQATINCTQDEKEVFRDQDGCPYFTPTGLNGGWKWELVLGDISNCTVAVTFVDFNDPFSSPLTNERTFTVNNTATCQI